MEKLNNHNEHIGFQKQREELFSTQVYQRLKKMSLHKDMQERPTEKDWRELQEAFRQHLPEVLELMKEASLNHIQYRLCMLLYLGFRTKEMAMILGIRSYQQVSNVKRIVKKKLALINNSVLFNTEKFGGYLEISDICNE